MRLSNLKTTFLLDWNSAFMNKCLSGLSFFYNILQALQRISFISDMSCLLPQRFHTFNVPIISISFLYSWAQSNWFNFSAGANITPSWRSQIRPIVISDLFIVNFKNEDLGFILCLVFCKMEAYVLHGLKCYHMIYFCPNYIITLETETDPLKFPTSSPNYLVAGKTPMAE